METQTQPTFNFKVTKAERQRLAEEGRPSRERTKIIEKLSELAIDEELQIAVTNLLDGITAEPRVRHCKFSGAAYLGVYDLSDTAMNVIHDLYLMRNGKRPSPLTSYA